MKKTSKVNKILSKYEKIYNKVEKNIILEADEKENDNTDNEDSTSGDSEDDVDITGDGEGDDGTVQEDTPVDENTIMISPQEKANLAKIMLNALLMSPPNELPNEILNVTVDNADYVIKTIQAITSLNNSISTDGNGELAQSISNNTF